MNLRERLIKLWRLASYSLIAALPLQTHYLISTRSLHGELWEFGRLMIYGTDILLVMILTSGFALKQWSRHKNKKTNYLLGLATLVLGLGLIGAEDKVLASYQLIRLALGIGLFVLVTSCALNKKIIIKLLIATASLQALWGLGQFLLQSAPANKWLGLADHNPQTAGVSVVETIAADGYGERWLRAYGGLPHPNILGGLLAIALVLILGWGFEKDQGTKTGPRQNYWQLVAVALLSVGLFVSFSRSAILAGLVGLVIIIVGRFKQWRKLMPKLLIITASLGICAWHYGYLYQARLQNQTRLEIKSVKERMDLNQRAWELIKAKPLTGVGAGNFGLAVWQQDEQKREVFAYQPVHNVWLLIGAELGLITLLLLIYGLAWIVKKTWQQRALNSGALIVSLIILLSLDHYLWTQALGVYLLALVLGMVVDGD